VNLHPYYGMGSRFKDWTIFRSLSGICRAQNMNSSRLTASPSLVCPVFTAQRHHLISSPRLGTSPPSLIIVVSGNVTHGRSLSSNPRNTSAKPSEGQPHVFSQTFILVPDANAPTRPGEVAKYYISADSLRFVG